MTTRDDIPSQFDNDDDILEEFSDLHVRPFMQSTVVAAEYDNEFFDPSQGNTTYLINDLEDDAVLSSWSKISSAISDGTISPADILSIIELAVNARSVSGTGRLLDWVNRPASVITGVADLSRTRLMNAKVASGVNKQYVTDDDYTLAATQDNEGEPPIDEEDDGKLKVKAACYICLCLMRLMKKDPTSFMKGITYIKRGFSLFYEQASATVLNLEFSRAAIIAISDGLRSNAKLGQTMIYHVATGMKSLERTSQEYHLMRFTFCQHVELKGMHAYKLFYELDRVFNDRLPTPVFLSWLTNDATRKAVMLIADIIKKYDNENETSEYLWLYARYLNNGYFYDLHTARCRWLVCVLGHLHKAQIPSTTTSQGSPLDLLELKKMSKAEWATAKEYAEIFEEQYTRQAAASTTMNRIQREYQKRKGIATPRPEKRKRADREGPDAMVVEPTEPPAGPPSKNIRKRNREDVHSSAGRRAAEEPEDEDGSDGEAPPVNLS
uniref:Nucleoprotein n=1 Tax=Viola verecunda virus 1 TaxID=2793744 RepID=A0A8D9UJ62_9RHAB|nr:TPA_asm: N [Viola verecunda virus 1]